MTEPIDLGLGRLILDAMIEGLPRRIFILTALLTFILGLLGIKALVNHRVGTPPKDGYDGNLAFAIPQKLTSQDAQELRWLIFGDPTNGMRKVEVSVDSVCVYRNVLPPFIGTHPSIRGLVSRFTLGVHELRILDLYSGEVISTNFSSGVTKQIEIDFNPLKVGVYSEVNWIYL